MKRDTETSPLYGPKARLEPKASRCRRRACDSLAAMKLRFKRPESTCRHTDGPRNALSLLQPIAIIPQHVEQIVSVFVLAANPQRQ